MDKQPPKKGSPASRFGSKVLVPPIRDACEAADIGLGLFFALSNRLSHNQGYPVSDSNILQFLGVAFCFRIGGAQRPPTMPRVLSDVLPSERCHQQHLLPGGLTPQTPTIRRMGYENLQGNRQLGFD
jgi:hypothetical protein